MSRYTFSQYDEDRDVNISFEAVSMSEILDHFRSFMLASGFQISQEEYIDVVKDEEYDDEPIILTEANYGMGDIDLTFTDDYQPAPANFSPDSISLNDTYGTTTSFLTPSEK